MSEGSEVNYKVLYEEVCRQHDGIADFRAKLLGFLPFASGVGIFLLVNSGGNPTNLSPHLFAIGVFGILVTIGLFVHELRGIEKCVALITAGEALEKMLSSEYKGAFRSKPLTVEMRQPALIIYSAAVLAWAYMAAVGAASLPKEISIIYVVGIIVALAMAFGFFFWGRWELDKEKYRRGL